MDDPNYKMKNIYSSVSPSEIALRCTILDLCQRLKRTEVLCDYYEQCRNELVSDCIRLRQERDYYLMAHRNSLQRSEACKPKSSPANNNHGGPPVDTSQLRQSNKIQPSFSFEKEIDFPKTTEPDDNYEEIAKRLIAQFREEMEEIRRASMNGPQQSTSSNPTDTSVATGSHIPKGRLLPPPPPLPPTTTTTTAINYPGDSSSTLPTMLVSPVTPARQSSQLLATNCDELSASTKLLTDLPSPYDISSTSSSSAYRNHHQQQQGHHNVHHPHHHQNRQRHVNSNNGLAIEDTSELRDVPTVIEVNSGRDNYPNPVGGEFDRGGDQQSPTRNHEAEQYYDLVNKLLKNGINDFDTLTRMLMNQNEKLRKLKGKQLRNYFKRQLDQNNETINIPKRP